ncbi:type I restriction-modification system subunit M [Acinetobacter nectaris]|uniref:type I restriction-modification system subunit M n=1 Tax=Acinetobacter nectaris TaxID=1219382 RepID=UPI001F014A0B|nr:type I restriction-modification system subunit M [Acinetobacter nectaris]
MVTQINQDTVNQALWSACNVFHGTTSTDIYKDFILTMLFLKYISDVWQDHYDNYKKAYGDEPELIEEMMKNERFVLPRQSNFYSLYDHRYEAGNGERIDFALHTLEEANAIKLKEVGISVFQDISFNTDQLGEEKQKNVILKDLLEAFASTDLDLKPSRIGSIDVIGNSYEFLIKNFAASGSQQTREFYTPPEVSDLIAELLAPQKGDSICDPACGSGSLLIKCGRKVVSNHNSKQYALYGQEVIASIWSIAKMNMFLHGEDNHRIELGDTIRNPKFLDQNGDLMLFDIVSSTPPFLLEDWGSDTAESDKFDRFHRGIPPKTKCDYAFISHMIETLKPTTGRMGVVVPHGVLFRGSYEGKIRQKLIDENLLDAVISLPEKLFYGTGIPAAILIFKKQKSDDTVLFIDASREFKSGKNQNNLTVQNITKIVETYRTRESVDKYAYLATLQELKDNDYNLNIPRYVDTSKKEEEIDLIAVHTEREQLKIQLAELEIQMAKHLKQLGLAPNG